MPSPWLAPSRAWVSPLLATPGSSLSCSCLSLAAAWLSEPSACSFKLVYCPLKRIDYGAGHEYRAAPRLVAA